MSEESAITVTLKAGAGYDAPWVVVRGDSPQQVAERLSALQNSGLAAQATNAAIDLHATYAGASGLGARAETAAAPAFASPSYPTTPVYNADVAYQAPNPPPMAQAAPNGLETRVDKYNNRYTFGVPGAPTCPHGTRILKEGTKKDGSGYKAYVCPQIDNFYRVQTDCKAIYQ